MKSNHRGMDQFMKCKKERKGSSAFWEGDKGRRELKRTEGNAA